MCPPWGSWNVFCLPCFPRQYLVTDYNTHRAAVIPQRQMEEFIYLYESMPYNIELMNRPLEDYLQKKQRIRITGGVFRGKRGGVSCVCTAIQGWYSLFWQYDGGSELSSCVSV